MASAETGCTRCVMVSETVLRFATSTSSGDFSIVSASFLISFEKVAEKSRLCRVSFGSRLMMRVTSGMKPMSSMRSASSRTRPARSGSSALLLDQIEQAAGVATRNRTPLADGFDLRLDVDAAIDAQRAERSCTWRSPAGSHAPGWPVRVSAPGSAHAPDAWRAKGSDWHAVTVAAAAAA